MTSGVRPLPPLPRPGWPKRLPCLLCDRPRLTYSPNDRRCDRCRKSIEGVDESVLYTTGTKLDHGPVDLPTSAADGRSWKAQAAAKRASNARATPDSRDDQEGGPPVRAGARRRGIG